MHHAPATARSWLFAPGDSEKKMTKAMEGSADIVLIDLEDAVAPESKAVARPMVHDFIAANPAPAPPCVSLRTGSCHPES